MGTWQPNKLTVTLPLAEVDRVGPVMDPNRSARFLSFSSTIEVSGAPGITAAAATESVGTVATLPNFSFLSLALSTAEAPISEIFNTPLVDPVIVLLFTPPSLALVSSSSVGGATTDGNWTGFRLNVIFAFFASVPWSSWSSAGSFFFKLKRKYKST